MKRIATCAVAALLSAGAASAQVTVTGTQTGLFGATAAGTYSIAYQVQNPNSVLVFGTYVDGGGGASTAISFGSGVGNQAANGLITVDRSSLSYFLNPSTSAGLSISVTAGTGDKGYFLWELAGVDLSAPVQSASGANGGTQLLTLSPNAFITDFFGVNDFGITGGLAGINPDGNSILTKINGTFVVPGGGWAVGGQATAGSAGAQELGWTVTGGFGNYGELAYAFTAVPEPSVFGLMGISALAFWSMRRRLMH
jgi:hypothetical protein